MKAADVVHAATFADDAHLRRVVANYIRRYNRIRLHSSLGYRSPRRARVGVSIKTSCVHESGPRSEQLRFARYSAAQRSAR